MSNPSLDTATAPPGPSRPTVGVALIDGGIKLRTDWLQRTVREVWVCHHEGCDQIYARGGGTGWWLYDRLGDQHGHGTLMAEQLGEPKGGLVPSIELYVYRLTVVRSPSPMVACRPLLQALKHVENRPDVSVVNLSVTMRGAAAPVIRDLTHTFNDVFARLRDRGKLVVTTAGNADPGRPDQQTPLPGSAHRGFTVGAAEWRDETYYRCDDSLCCTRRSRTGRVHHVPHAYCDVNTLRGTSVATARTSGIASLGIERLLAVPPQPLTADEIGRVRRALAATGDPVLDSRSTLAPPRRCVNVQSFLAELAHPLDPV